MRRITAEQRANILEENRQYGFSAVPPSAPEWVRERLTVERTAIIEGRSVPDYTATEIDAIHKRVVEQQGRAIRAAQAAAVSADAAIRARLDRIGEEIRRQGLVN